MYVRNLVPSKQLEGSSRNFQELINAHPRDSFIRIGLGLGQAFFRILDKLVKSLLAKALR